MEEEGLSVEERSPTVILDFVWSPNAEISTIDQLPCSCVAVHYIGRILSVLVRLINWQESTGLFASVE